MDVDHGNPLEVLRARITVLEQELSDTKQHHEEIVQELFDDEADLKYSLSKTQSELRENQIKLSKRDDEVYELRRLVLQTADQLIARELRKSNETVEVQLAETQRFIMALGGRLRDLSRGIADQERRRSRVNN
ncbi:hypothetical protein B0H10DRAFT_1955133 [Mycena sp. CBHHK59/15]|nr:hypothetical protein B0H10DRAFT_1955133 [Mycena sp. CBHHK59/15]